MPALATFTDGDELQKDAEGDYSLWTTGPVYVKQGSRARLKTDGPTQDQSWVTLTVADDTNSYPPGRYRLDSSGGPFSILLDHDPDKDYIFADIDDADDNNITIGSAADTFNGGPGPLVIDISRTVTRVIAMPAANTYEVYAYPGLGYHTSIQAEQSADFTVSAGNQGLTKEWPVDVSGQPANSQLTITGPATADVGDSFAIYDSRVACTRNRTIRVNFFQNLQGSATDTYAVINTPGSRIEFTYHSPAIGWRVASNRN